MESVRRALFAIVLVAVALTATAYATYIGGASTVSTDEISVNYSLDTLSGENAFPTGSAVERTIGTITLGNFSGAGLNENDNIRVRFELIIDNPDIVIGLRSLVVQISKASGGSTTGVVALLTPQRVYDEAVEKLSGVPPSNIVYNVRVIAVAGDKKLDTVSFRLRATAIVENMA